MTTGKPTKQQVIEALLEERISGVFQYSSDNPDPRAAEFIASALVKAGLIEEPRIEREPGFYWTKWIAGQKWVVSEWDGSKWIGQRGTIFDEEPDVYSRRILPPED